MICRSKLSLILFLASLATQSYGFIWIPIPGTKEYPWKYFFANRADVIGKKNGDHFIFTFKLGKSPYENKSIDCTIVDRIENIPNQRYYTDKVKLRENDGFFVRTEFVLFWKMEGSSPNFSGDDYYSQKVLTPLASGLIISGLAAAGGAYFWVTK